MSAPDDDGTEMDIRRSSPTLTEAEADALLSGRAREGDDDLREILGLMRTAAAVSAPPPSAALTSVLEDGFDPLPVTSAPPESRWGRWSVRLAVAAATAMTVTLGAATANALPARLQTAVADVVDAVTPLRLPRPAVVPDSGSTDSGGPGGQPAGVPAPVSGGGTDAGHQEPTASVTPKAPAGVSPLQRPGATDADPAETDERETDEPESDEPESDEPRAGEPAGEQSETEGPDSDQPDATEANESDADLPEVDEPELDVDAQPDQDDPDRAD